ncbi:MAG: hypothetical protein EBQ92_08510 [Proteobacteria bacterium]|nr:hypothetical protein [Pseudomonadota bacterium]
MFLMQLSVKHLQMKYYKVTNKKENHRGFQYKDGLNELKEKFNDDPTKSCRDGAAGLYFTTSEYIHKFMDYGINIREVILPVDDPDFKMVKDPYTENGEVYRANKIILGHKYKLAFSSHGDLVNTILIFNLFKYDKFIDWFASSGRINMLYWLQENNHEIKITNDTIDLASKYGREYILDFFSINRYDFKYSENAVATSYIKIDNS